MPGYTYVIYYIADPDEEIPVTQANPSSLIDVFAMSILLKKKSDYGCEIFAPKQILRIQKKKK